MLRMFMFVTTDLYSPIFRVIDENLTNAELYDEMVELCSWYGDGEEYLDNEDEDETMEMIKRHVDAQMKYAPAPASLKRKSSAHIGLSSLCLSSSPNRQSINQITTIKILISVNKRPCRPSASLNDNNVTTLKTKESDAFWDDMDSIDF